MWLVAIIVVAGLGHLVIGLVAGFGAAATIASLLLIGAAATAAARFYRMPESSHQTWQTGAEPPQKLPNSQMTQASWDRVVKALAEGAIVTTSEGRTIAFNGAAQDLYPALRRDMPFIGVARNPELVEALARAASSRQPDTVTFLQRVPLERRLTASIGILDPAMSADDAALFITFRDLTAQERINEMRADFVANASHELRTPLAAIIGFLETLRGTAKNDEAARERFLGIMAEQAARMQRLIDDMLSLSRIEMSEHVLPDGIVDVTSALDDVVDMLATDAQQTGTTVTTHGTNEELLVRGDRDELVQVFQNLLQNAIKYGRAGGNVDVSVTRSVAPDNGRQGTIAIAFKDDGPGIAPKDVPRLTERFYRVDVQSSRKRGGTGLGLAIVKHILNRHRGELRIASELGRGSTFTVILPELPPATRA